MQKTIYFAGGLFDHKELVGNALLAKAIEEVSGGRYAVRLPQFITNTCAHVSLETRDADFNLMLSCDCIVANFDGSDLDSGTVVEFCFAKVLDYPAVLLRTDFRKNGDQDATKDPWNLMCSGYPRTKPVWLDGMSEILKQYGASPSPADYIPGYERAIAKHVVDALDALCEEKPVFDKDEMLKRYQDTVKAIGGTLPQNITDDALKDIVASKIEKGIYC